jgi:protein TIF31
LNSVSASIHENREKQNGDIKYITIVILEGRELEVTCNERGFFINSSTSTSFNPSPSESSFFSYTLSGLLCQVSTMFKENFTKLLSQVLSVDPLLFQPSPQMKFDWLKPQDNLFYCNYRGNLTLNRDSLVFSKKGQREWNEEFQIIFDKKMVDIADQADNFYKDKYTDVVYNDFRDAAIEGVKLISEKQLLPINYTSMDNISKGLYIYDNIFLSILEDSNNFQVILCLIRHTITMLMLKLTREET